MTSVIYWSRYLWATNSRHSSPWIDTAAVQSRNLIGTARPPSLLWRCTLLLLNLRIPPSSSSHPPPPASLRQPWETQRLRLKFVKSEQIYAGAARLLLCLLGPNSWTITAIVLNVAEKWTFPQFGYFLRVMFSQSWWLMSCHLKKNRKTITTKTCKLLVHLLLFDNKGLPYLKAFPQSVCTDVSFPQNQTDGPES